MLKLEKQTKNRNINIIIKECGRLTSPAFFQALAIACALHLVGLILFQVAPFKLKHATSIFPPIEVNIDYRGVLAESRNEEISLLPIPEPQISRPRIGGSVGGTETFNHKGHRDTGKELFGRNEIEELMNPVLEKTQVYLHVFGELAGRPYNLENVDKTSYGNEVIAYHVKVEDRTGKIFWYEPTNQIVKKKQKKIVKKIFDRLRFKTNDRGFISEGYIEIGSL
jgi:hypothetical protein